MIYARAQRVVESNNGESSEKLSESSESFFGGTTSLQFKYKRYYLQKINLEEPRGKAVRMD